MQYNSIQCNVTQFNAMQFNGCQIEVTQPCFIIGYFLCLQSYSDKIMLRYINQF